MLFIVLTYLFIIDEEEYFLQYRRGELTEEVFSIEDDFNRFFDVMSQSSNRLEVMKMVARFVFAMDHRTYSGQAKPEEIDRACEAFGLVLDIMVSLKDNPTSFETLGIELRDIADIAALKPVYLRKPEYILTILELAKQAKTQFRKSSYYGALTHLLGLETEHTDVVEEGTKQFLEILGSKTVDNETIGNALDIMNDATVHDHVRRSILALNAKGTLERLIENHPDLNFAVQLILARINASEVQGGGSTENLKGLKAHPDVISNTLKCFKNFTETTEGSIQTIPLYYGTYFTTLRSIISSAQCLALNEENTSSLYKGGVIEVLEKFIKKRHDMISDIMNLKELADLFYTLSFDSKLAKKMKENRKVYEFLKSLKDEEASIQKLAEGIFSQIEPKDPTKTKAEEKGQIMISYSWSQQTKAIQLRDYLKKKGYTIWIDVERMKDSILESMADAVESSILIICCISSSYKESNNCRREASYADKLKKPLMFVIAEDNYKPTGWLGILLESQRYYNLWEKGKSKEEEMHRMHDAILKRIQKQQLKGNNESCMLLFFLFFLFFSFLFFFQNKSKIKNNSSPSTKTEVRT